MNTENEIVIALVGVEYVPCVRENNLHEPTDAANFINEKLLFLDVIERIEDAEYFHTRFRWLFAELVNYVIGIVHISPGVGAAQRHMKQNV